jgi:hypothetical protein
VAEPRDVDQRHPSDALARPEPLDLLRQLEREGNATLVSLDLADDLLWETFAALCTYLGKLRNATAFWIGDALNYGDAVFGFDASQAEAFLGRSPETLRRWQWACEKVPKPRRRAGLSFTHHENVAALAPDEQVRWLDHAEQHGLSPNELRSAIRSAAEQVEAASGSESVVATEPILTSTKVIKASETGGDAVVQAARNLLAVAERRKAVGPSGRVWYIVEGLAIEKLRAAVDGAEQHRLVEVERKRKGEPGS